MFLTLFESYLGVTLLATGFVVFFALAEDAFAKSSEAKKLLVLATLPVFNVLVLVACIVVAIETSGDNNE